MGFCKSKLVWRIVIRPHMNRCLYYKQPKKTSLLIQELTEDIINCTPLALLLMMPHYPIARGSHANFK